MLPGQGDNLLLEGHTTFPGRHAYFHDPDGNGIEIVDLYKT